MSHNGKLDVPYPGIPTTSDGAGAVVWVETHISQGAGAFPITSSTTMAHGYNTAVVNGQPNLWGEQLQFFEPESEHSSGHGLRRVRPGRRSRDQLHLRSRVNLDERSAVYYQRQTLTGGVSHWLQGANQPQPQRSRRA